MVHHTLREQNRRQCRWQQLMADPSPVSTEQKAERNHLRAQLVFSSSSSYGVWVSPTFKTALTISVNLFWKRPHRKVYLTIFLYVVKAFHNPLKWTLQIYHYIQFTDGWSEIYTPGTAAKLRCANCPVELSLQPVDLPHTWETEPAKQPPAGYPGDSGARKCRKI